MSLTPMLVTKFIVDTLAAEAAQPGSPLAGVPVWDGIAPLDEPYPLIQIQHIATTTRTVLGGRKLWDEGVYQVEAFGRSPDFVPLMPIANRVDDVLHMASGSVTGGTVVDVISEMPIKAQDAPVQGVIYAHLGARYRIHAQTT